MAREVFDLTGFWSELEALDGKVESSVQIAALLEGRKLTERAARWLLHARRPPFDIQATIDYFADGVLAVGEGLPGLLGGRDLAGYDDRVRDVRRPRRSRPRWPTGWPRWCPPTRRSTSWTSPAGTGRPATETAAVYFDLADRLQIARLRDMITALPRDDRWTTMARGAIRDDLYAAHAALARDVLTVTEPGTPAERLAAWERRNESAVRRAAQTLTEIWESNSFNVATLSVAVRAIRTLVATSGLPA